MRTLLELVFVLSVAWWVFKPSDVQCDCEKLPENYFVVETKETETCIDENRQTIITKVIKSGKVESK